MLAVPISHPLSRKDSVCIQDLAGQKILRLKTCELYLDQILETLCKKNHIKTNFIWQNDYMIFSGLCSNTQYLFMTSTLQACDKYENRVILPFNDPQLTVTLYLHYLENNANAKIFSSWVQNI